MCNFQHLLKDNSRILKWCNRRVYTTTGIFCDRRKSLLKVDCDIIFLGIYYVIVIFSYLIFEMMPVNYRPILIEGFLEASYPSSTTLLVLFVMPTLIEQINRRSEKKFIRHFIKTYGVEVQIDRFLQRFLRKVCTILHMKDGG